MFASKHNGCKFLGTIRQLPRLRFVPFAVKLSDMRWRAKMAIGQNGYRRVAMKVPSLCLTAALIIGSVNDLMRKALTPALLGFFCSGEHSPRERAGPFTL